MGQADRQTLLRKAVVAVACTLAVIMHAMWSDGTHYIGDATRPKPTPSGARRSRIAAFWERTMNRTTPVERDTAAEQQT